jgi:hypothetical protein
LAFILQFPSIDAVAPSQLFKHSRVNLQVAFADINIAKAGQDINFSECHFSQSTAKEAGHEMQIQSKSRESSMLRVSSRPVGFRFWILDWRETLSHRPICSFLFYL